MHEEFWVTHFHSQQGWIVGADSVPDARTLTFNQGSGQVELFDFRGEPLDRNALIKGNTDPFTVAQHTATVLCQRGMNHPADHGFVWADTPPGDYSTSPLPARAVIPERLQESVHHETVTDGGWFPPNTDPAQFGALYLGCSTSSWFTPVTVWQVRQVGLDDPVDSARWDDSEGCARLRAIAANPDMHSGLLVQAALTRNPDEFTADKNAAVRRHTVLAAREAFTRPRDRIKPRLVAECFDSVDALWPHTNRRVVSLNGDRIASAPIPPVNVAVVIDLHDDPDAGHLRPLSYVPGRWAAALDGKLQERHLGNLFRYYDGAGYVCVVAKNPDLLFQHSQALDIVEGAVVERFVSDDSGQARWVPAYVTGKGVSS